MEFVAKTVKEAIEKGLAELNLTEEQANVYVIEEPVKGLFGRLKGNAVVEITAKETLVSKKAENNQLNKQKATELVEKVLSLMGIEANATLSEKDEKTVITLSSEDSSALIGYRGEVLDALQTLAGAMANIGNKTYKKVVVDCENYRDRREETLVKLAHKLEEKATEMKREVLLEAMNPFERRIIHTALAESATVTTRSEGKEPNRYVVIVPNDKDEYSKPYNAGRNNKRDGKGARNDRRSRPSGKGSSRSSFSSGKPAPRKTTSVGFGTYLGNSLKDKD